MFNDIWIARKSALSLVRTLMVVTMIIAVGTQYSFITADDHDSSLIVFRNSTSSRKSGGGREVPSCARRREKKGRPKDGLKF